MERLTLNFNLPTPKKHQSERGELLDYFFEFLSPTWGGRRPLTKSYLAMKISHLKLEDLYYLKSSFQDRVNRGENYSKYFWGVLKVKS
jgi:hypothetical protein